MPKILIATTNNSKFFSQPFTQALFYLILHLSNTPIYINVANLHISPPGRRGIAQESYQRLSNRL